MPHTASEDHGHDKSFAGLRAWVDEVAALTQPDEIHSVRRLR